MNKWNFAFFLLILLHTIVNLWWINTNQSPLPWDPAAHTFIALDIKDAVSRFDFLGILNASNYYPIFVHSIAGVLAFFLNIRWLQFTVTFFFIGLLVVIFLYVQKIYHDVKVAFWSSALFSFFPIVYDQSRWLMLDIPLSFFIVLALYFLDSSELFAKRSLTFAFFISVALAVLTKWSSVLYFIIPLLFLLPRLKIFLKKKKQNLSNIILGSLGAVLIVSPWYILHAKSLFDLMGLNIVGEKTDPSIWTFENFVHYFRIFVNNQVTFVVALLAIVSFFYIAKSKVKQKQFLLAMIVGNYLIFSLVGNKDPRYTIPILPFVAISIALFISLLQRTNIWLGRLLIFGLAFYLFAYFFILNFRPAFAEGKRLSFHTPIFGWINIVDVTNELVTRYDKNTWHMPDILADLETLSSARDRDVVFLVAFDFRKLNPENLRVYIKRLGIKNVRIKTPDIVFLYRSYGRPYFPTRASIRKYIADADYGLLPLYDVGPVYLRNRKALEQLQEYLVGHKFIPRCRQFTSQVAKNGAVCLVEQGEILETGSDVYVDGEFAASGTKKIHGLAKVYCPWGCSFKQIAQPTSRIQKKSKFELLKIYSLPDGQKIGLFSLFLDKEI